ncbi:hypothetical protein [Ruegeria sp. SCP11]|uniref:hypothetical protein n=1 Tax=Ruegeria sp. SCP11 TaxID=3141378 RepID=UPI0033358F78
MTWQGTLVPGQDEKKNDRPGWRVTHVYPGSPAFRSGIKVGWELQTIDNRTVFAHRLCDARSSDSCILRFVDEEGNIHLWEDQRFPFGLRLLPPIDPFFRHRVKFDELTEEDRATLIDRFALGKLEAFSDLIPEIQTALGVKQSFFARAGFRPLRKYDSVPISDDDEFLDFLALGYLEQKKFDLAKKASRAAEDARGRLGRVSFSRDLLAINYFVKAQVFLAEGDVEEATYWAEGAWTMRPEYEALKLFFWTLTGEQPQLTEPAPTNEAFPFTYTLPNTDPVGEIACSGEAVSLQDELAAMSQGQLLILVIYGPYRSNYYGNLEIERLAQLHAACPEIIAGVHVVCSSNYAHSDEHRHETEGLAQQLGLPLKILWDEQNEVMERLEREGSPFVCALGKDGTVLSTKCFAEEEGLWEALGNAQ